MHHYSLNVYNSVRRDMHTKPGQVHEHYFCVSNLILTMSYTCNVKKLI